MSSPTLTTFGAIQEKFGVEEQPAEVTTTEVQDQPAGEEQQSQPTLEQPAAEQAAVQQPAEAQPETPAAESDYSTSSFSLGGEEPAAQEPAAEAAAAAPAQFNLDEELNKVDKKELFKKLGLNDFVVELNDHLANGGSAIDYLNAKAIDYNQVADENIIKSNLQKQFPTFTPQQIELYFNRKYGVDELATDEEKEFASLTLKADAHNMRQQLIEEQKKFKIPEAITPVKDEAYEQWKQYRESQEKTKEQVDGYYLNHAATKSLHENKKVAINVGENVPPFNFSIDRPELITKSFTDGGETWQKLTSTQTGEPDVQKQQLIALFSFNPQKFIQDIFNYGQQLGKRSLVSEGQNAQRPQVAASFTPDAKVSYGVGTYGAKSR